MQTAQYTVSYCGKNSTQSLCWDEGFKEFFWDAEGFKNVVEKTWGMKGFKIIGMKGSKTLGGRQVQKHCLTTLDEGVRG